MRRAGHELMGLASQPPYLVSRHISGGLGLQPWIFPKSSFSCGLMKWWLFSRSIGKSSKPCS